jgi:hypothetical protein
MFALLVVLFIIAVVGLLVGSFVLSSRRQKKFAAYAAARGFQFEKRNSAYEDLPWGDPFGIGHSRMATDVFTGTVGGRPAICFDYQYTTTSGSGQNRTSSTTHHAIFWIRLPKALGELRVGREGLGSKIARAVGVHDIELESEEFNHRFSVKSEDRKFAYDVLNPQLMEWLMSVDAPGFRIHGADLLLIQSGRLQLEDIEPRLTYLAAVTDRIPAIVWDPH